MTESPNTQNTLELLPLTSAHVPAPHAPSGHESAAQTVPIGEPVLVFAHDPVAQDPVAHESAAQVVPIA